MQRDKSDSYYSEPYLPYDIKKMLLHKIDLFGMGRSINEAAS